MNALKRFWCVVTRKCPLIPPYVPEEDPEIRFHRGQRFASEAKVRRSTIEQDVYPGEPMP